MTTADESIIERIAAGDSRAVSECLEQFGGLVWSIANNWSDSAADAEDATQEIFLEIWKSAERYDRARGSEAVFISTIARRRMIDRLRAQERRPSIEELTERHHESIADPAGDDIGLLAADAAIATRAVAELDADQQEVLIMGVVEGMTHSEIAEITGKPLGTVKTQIRRGLLRVRELIEQGEVDAS